MRRAWAFLLLGVGARFVHRALSGLSADERESWACKMVDSLESQHVRPTSTEDMAAMRAAIQRVLNAPTYTAPVILDHEQYRRVQ